MNGFLLAAGRGRRLKHLTEHTAKPALPVAGLPMLAYSLSFFYRAGVKKLAVNTHHCPQTITEILNRAKHPFELIISHETKLLDTGGGVKKCEEFLNDDTILLANGDVVCDLDAKKLIDFHRAQQATLTLVVVPHAHADTIAPVTLDAKGQVTDINRALHKDSTGNHLYAGIAVFEPELFAFLQAEPSSIVYTGYTGLIAAGQKVMAYVHEGFWYDCGTPENYALVNAEVAEHWTHWSKVLHPAVLGQTQRPGKPPEMHQHSHDSLRRP